MATIRTAIELQDNFTTVLMGIVNSVNSSISVMENMQQTMSTPVDTDSLENARQEIEQVAAAVEAMNASVESSTASINASATPVSDTSIQVPVEPQLPDPIVEQPPPVEIPIEWQSDSLEVFTGSGAERFEQEIQSANTKLEQLSQTQQAISQQALTTKLFPQDMLVDMGKMESRIQAIQSKIKAIENNKLNLGTDRANNGLEQLRGQLEQALQAQNKLNFAVEQMDISSANVAYQQLSTTIGNTERYIRNNVNEQGLFNQELQNGTVQANNLTGTIKRAVGAYVGIQSVSKVLDISDELVQTRARLDLMNDGVQTTDELTNAVYASAQRARGSFSDMAAVVAKFGNNAGDAFGSSKEVVDFAELVQKQMTIAGASTQESSNAMLQLAQALGSGVLRGDELNSIFEQAPNLIQGIADYLDVPIGKIRDMAKDGEITADIVKASVFASADEINAKFESMPMTWGQLWQSFKNTALMAFQPVLLRINDLANSPGLQTFINGVAKAMAIVAGMILNIFDLIAAVAGFVADNWSIISPIIWGIVFALIAYYTALGIYNTIKAISAMREKIHAASLMMESGATFAATAAQYGFNAALLACPLTWIIIAVIAVIALIFAVCNKIAEMTGIADSGFGVICGGVNVVIQFFKNLGLSIANIALGIGNAIAALGSNIMTAFHNAICSVQSWWYDLLSTCLSVIESICVALNKLPFVEFDYSGITNAADDYAAKAAEAAGNKKEYQSIGDAFNKGMSTFDTFQDGWASDAYDAGAAWGDSITDKISNFSVSDLFGGTDIPNPDDYAFSSDMSDIADNTSDIKDSLDITDEDLKYLRDLAEQETINRFTTAEINVDMSGMKNNLSGTGDIDGFVTTLTDAVNEATAMMAEGVHA